MKEGLFQTLWDLVERVITPVSPATPVTQNPPLPQAPRAPATPFTAPPKQPAPHPVRAAPASPALAPTSPDTPAPRRKPRLTPQVRIVPTVAIPDLPTSPTAQEHYDHIVRLMLAKYNIKVRKWRKSSSGIAYELLYRDGTIKRLIESPYPKGPMSMAIFLHEIGHHAIGFHVYKPRCLEEYHAWAFAIAAMEEHGLNITDSVRRRMHRSLHYAVSKAARRGLKTLPSELVPYLQDAPKKAA